MQDMKKFVEKYDLFPKGKTAERYDAKRQQANREILAILTEYVEKNPSMRMIQILISLQLSRASAGSFQDFNEEPWETLRRVEERYTQ